VAHTCNPNYLGDRKQKDHGSKPAPDKYFMKSYLDKTQHKTELTEWLKWYSVCLASMMLQVQAPVLQTNK
jgi:hypothetical protein